MFPCIHINFYLKFLYPNIGIGWSISVTNSRAQTLRTATAQDSDRSRLLRYKSAIFPQDKVVDYLYDGSLLRFVRI